MSHTGHPHLLCTATRQPLTCPSPSSPQHAWLLRQLVRQTNGRLAPWQSVALASLGVTSDTVGLAFEVMARALAAQVGNVPITHEAGEGAGMVRWDAMACAVICRAGVANRAPSVASALVHPHPPLPTYTSPLPPQLSGWVLVGSEPAASEGPVLSAGQDELIIFISGVESDPSAPDMSPYSAYTLDRLVDPRPRGPGLSCATTHAAVQASRRRALNSSRPIRRMRGFMAAFSRSAGVL